MYEEMKKSRQQYNVAMEVLSYHFQEEEKEIICYKPEDLPAKAPYLLRYDFSSMLFIYCIMSGSVSLYRITYLQTHLKAK